MEKATFDFICGKVVCKNGVFDRALENVNVILFIAGKEVAAVTTNFFGDFKIEKISIIGQTIKLSIGVAGFNHKDMQFCADRSCLDLGVIYLDQEISVAPLSMHR